MMNQLPMPGPRPLDMTATKVNYPKVLVPVFSYEQTNTPHSLMFLDVPHDKVILGGSNRSRPVAADLNWSTYLVDTRRDRIGMVSLDSTHHDMYGHSGLENIDTGTVMEFTYHRLFFKVKNSEIAVAVSKVTADDMPSLELIKVAHDMLLSDEIPPSAFEYAYEKFIEKVQVQKKGSINQMYLVSHDLLDKLHTYFGSTNAEVHIQTNANWDTLLVSNTLGMYKNTMILFIAVANAHFSKLKMLLDCDAFKIDVGQPVDLHLLSQQRGMFSQKESAELWTAFSKETALPITVQVTIY